MSGFDLLYKDTIMLFNRCVMDNDDIVWYPTVLENVHLVLDRAKIVSMYGESSTDNAMVNIRFTGTRQKPVIAGKEYLSPKEFRKHPWRDADKYITFSFGDDFDFITVNAFDGVVEDGNYIHDDVYNSFGGFFNYMNKTYDNVFAITGSSQYNLIPHFSITAR